MQPFYNSLALIVISALLAASSSFAADNGRQSQDSGANPGPAADRVGNTAYDPTRNTESLVAAEARRLDQLREAEERLNAALRTAEERFNTAEILHVKELVNQERENQKALTVKEAGRLDSIREVDRQDVSKTAAAANIAITTLAKQTADLSTTLAKQVQDTAIATEARQTAFSTEVYKRLQSLELSSSERTGKQQVSDPQMERLANMVERMASTQSSSIGRSDGISDSWGWLAGGVMLLIAIGGYLKNGKDRDELIRHRHNQDKTA